MSNHHGLSVEEMLLRLTPKNQRYNNYASWSNLILLLIIIIYTCPVNATQIPDNQLMIILSNQTSYEQFKYHRHSYHKCTLMSCDAPLGLVCLIALFCMMIVEQYVIHACTIRVKSGYEL